MPLKDLQNNYTSQGMKTIEWKIHLKSDAARVYAFLTTDKGREGFWCENSRESDGKIHFIFPDGTEYESRIIKKIPDKEFCLDYFESKVSFKTSTSKDGGSDLILRNENIADDEYTEMHAGWVSVLMNLKAAVDFDIDLRNHNPKKTWKEKFVDN
jgi:uncharacterized protein YndB with AHSA1/START domain